jgi:hypothetical protein
MASCRPMNWRNKPAAVSALAEFVQFPMRRESRRPISHDSEASTYLLRSALVAGWPAQTIYAYYLHLSRTVYYRRERWETPTMTL